MNLKIILSKFLYAIHQSIKLFNRKGKGFIGENLKEFKKIIIYLQKQIELFANLCFGRNYVNKKYFKDNFNMSILMHYIWNPELSNGKEI